MLLWLRFRRWLWKRHLVPLPGAAGWEKLVQEVASVPLWQSDGLVGAPLEWSLLHRDPTGRVVADDACCTWSGLAVSGTTPVVNDAVDGTRWGVRCARCRVPIAAVHAGMAHAMAVPSCPPCRSRVRAFLHRLG